MLKDRPVSILLLTLFCILLPFGTAAKTQVNKHGKRHHNFLMRKAAWAGAGMAVGRVGGPAGSLSFGAFRHRPEIKTGGHARNSALVKVIVPVAAGVAFGPAGCVGYAVLDHRHWIRHHLLPHAH